MRFVQRLSRASVLILVLTVLLSVQVFGVAPPRADQPADLAFIDESLVTLARTVDAVARKLGAAQRFRGERRAQELCSLVGIDLAHPHDDAAKLKKLRYRADAEVRLLRLKPLLLVKTHPNEGAKILYPSGGIVIYGMTEKEAVVKINGFQVTVNPQGQFAAKVKLVGGANAVLIQVVRGTSSKTMRRTFWVTMDPALEKLDSELRIRRQAGLPAPSLQQTLKRLKKKHEDGEYTKNDHLVAVQTEQRLPKLIAKAPTDTTKPPAKPSEARLAQPPEEINMRVPEPPQRPTPPVSAIKPVPVTPFVPQASPQVFRIAAPDPRMALEKLAEAFRGKNDQARARFAAQSLKEVVQISRLKYPKVYPVLYHKRWGYRMTNGSLELVVWREAGRIARLRVDGIPLLRLSPELQYKAESGLGKELDGGGYRDLLKVPRLNGTENWNFRENHGFPHQAVLTARSYTDDGRFKIERRMRLTRNRSVLLLDYTVRNLTATDQRFAWMARVEPGIGFSDRNDGGDPRQDELLIPPGSNRPMAGPSLIEGGKYPTYETIEIPQYLFAFFDVNYQALLAFELDPKVARLNLLSSRDPNYRILLFESNEEAGLLVPPQGEITFSLKIWGLTGVRSREEALARLKALP